MQERQVGLLVDQNDLFREHHKRPQRSHPCLHRRRQALHIQAKILRRHLSHSILIKAYLIKAKVRLEQIGLDLCIRCHSQDRILQDRGERPIQHSNDLTDHDL